MAPSGGAPGAAVPMAPPTPEAAVPVETAASVEQAQPVDAVEPPPPPLQPPPEIAAAAPPPPEAAETELPPVIGALTGEEVAAIEPEGTPTRPVEPSEARAMQAEMAALPPLEAPLVEAPAPTPRAKPVT